MPNIHSMLIHAATTLCVITTSTALTAQDAAPPDLMSFAHGILPVAISTGDANLKVEMDHAIGMIDGNPTGFVAMRKPAGPDDAVEITYALPALTTFNGFSVPNALETPSPSQTFFGRVEISGSGESADGPFIPLAEGDLVIHEAPGEATALAMASDLPPVKWVRLRLSGGLDIQRDQSFFEFSEIIGTGTQEDPELSQGFSGVWSGRGVKLELAQEGAVVTGCYDGRSLLSGTVEGNVLRALGADDAGVPSQFILIAAPDGGIRGLRSSNGAPFKPYDGEVSDKTPVCLAPEPPTLGCGATVHGIGFDFDSDVIRPGSRAIIEDLFAGLSGEGATGITIVGHSSSEGAEDYNRDLSLRRAQSIANALVELGLDPAIITASGRGEDAPIASNDDEAGRSLNRRVEIECAG